MQMRYCAALQCWAILSLAGCNSKSPAASSAAASDVLVLTAETHGDAAMIVDGSAVKPQRDVAIPHGATLRTGADGSQTFVAADGTTGRVGPNTECRIDTRGHQQRPQFILQRGEILLTTKKSKAQSPEDVVVAVPSGIVRGDGAVFHVRITEATVPNMDRLRIVAVLCLTGDLRFEPRTGPPLTIPQGMEAVAMVTVSQKKNEAASPCELMPATPQALAYATQRMTDIASSLARPH